MYASRNWIVTAALLLPLLQVAHVCGNGVENEGANFGRVPHKRRVPPQVHGHMRAVLRVKGPRVAPAHCRRMIPQNLLVEVHAYRVTRGGAQNPALMAKVWLQKIVGRHRPSGPRG